MNQKHFDKEKNIEPGIKIMEAQHKNYELLREIFLTARQNTFSWLDPSIFLLEDFDKQTQGELILIAFIEDIPTGFISIWKPSNFIHHLYIDQKYQNKGIGTLLLNEALRHIKFPVTLKCLEDNTKAVDFYIRRGFLKQGKGQSENGNYILFELSKEIRQTTNNNSKSKNHESGSQSIQ